MQLTDAEQEKRETATEKQALQEEADVINEIMNRMGSLALSAQQQLEERKSCQLT